MTKEQFGQSLKTKYPQYQHIDNEELANKILDKYPVYNSQIDQKSKFRKVVDFFTENTQKFGTTLGTAASVVDPVTKRTREKTLSSMQTTIDGYIKRAKESKDKEEKKRLLNAAKSLGEVEGIDVFQNTEYQKTAKQVFGEGLGTALEVASLGSFGAKGLQAGKLGKALPTIAKPLAFGQTVKTGAKIGAAYGGAFGGGFGVSRAMQEDKSLGDIAKAGLTEGAIGTAGGAVFGGALSGLSAGASRGATRLTAQAQKLKKVAVNTIGESAYKKLNSVSRALLKMSPTQTRNEAKWNKNTPKFIVDEGVVGLLDYDGKYLNTDDAVSALRDKYNAESTVFNNLLADSGEWVSLNKFKEKALATIGDDFKTKGSDYQKAKNYIAKEIASYKSNYRSEGLSQDGDILVSIEDFNKIKSGLWSRTSNFNPSQADKLLSDLNYKMGQTAKALVEDTVDDVAIKSMNSRLGDFASALGVLNKANGKVLPGSFFGKQFTRLAGTVAGSGGGVPGSIIGNLTGGALADLMTNPKIKTATLTKILKLLNKTPKGASMIDEAEAVLRKRGETRASRKLLEASKTIITPEPGAGKPQLLTQEEAQEVLRELGTLPKTNPAVGQTVTKVDNLTQEARKYKTAEEFVESKKSLLSTSEDISNNRKFVLTKENLKRNLEELKKDGISLNSDETLTLFRGEDVKFGSGESFRSLSFWTTDKKVAKRINDNVFEIKVNPEDVVITNKIGDGITFQNLTNLVKAGDSYVIEKSQLIDEFNKAKPTLPKKPTLAQQAKKSDSLEEFIEAKGELVYRGGKDIDTKQITESGISVSKAKKIADDFVKQKGGKVEDIIIDKNAKTIDYADVPNVKYKELNDYSPILDKGDKQIWIDLEVEYQKAINWAKSNGYDAVRLPLEGETRVINPDILKTKSQLTDIFNNAK